MTAVRTEETRQKELEQIAAYKDLENLVNTKVRKPDDIIMDIV